MRLSPLVFSALALVAMPALAETPTQTPNRVVYAADFYAPIEPQTALDMIRRTPGFTLQEGDNRRGYAGSLGNVLVDGHRPAGKSQTLQDALQLIPARQVLRIEILSGADVAGDASGFSVLANIVRVPAAGQGIWGAGAEYANRGRAAPNGFINWSGRYHDTRYSIGGETYSLARDLKGGYRDRDGQGRPLSTGRESSPRSYYEYALNGSASHPVLGADLNLTGKLKYSRYHEDTTLVTAAPGGQTIGGMRTPYTETTQTGELGAQYERDLGPWRLSLVAIATRTHFFSGVRSTDAMTGNRFVQTLDHRKAENILRGGLARSFGRHRLELIYERANNSLDAALDLSFTAGGTTFPILVPDSNSNIAERRDDLALSDAWQVSPNLSAEFKLGYERSVLDFAGDTNRRVAYRFIKPSFSLTRRFGPNRLALRLYRDIGQINFADFVSAASLKDAVINGGNPELRPQTQWRAELAGDLHFSPKFTLNLTVYHSALSDTADLVPVRKDGVAYDAPGNIGKGTITGASLGLHVPLDRVVPGGTLQVSLMRQRTRVIDPLTHRPRNISNLPTSTCVLNFRQDLPKRHMAWGIDYSAASGIAKYRFDESDTTQVAPTAGLYVEKNNLGPYMFKATLYGFDGTPALRDRVFYTPDRSSDIARVEAQTHKAGLWLNLSLSRLF